MIFLILSALTLIASYFVFHKKVPAVPKELIALIFVLILFTVIMPFAKFSYQKSGMPNNGQVTNQTGSGETYQNGDWLGWFQSIGLNDIIKQFTCWLFMLAGMSTSVIVTHIKRRTSALKRNVEMPTLGWEQFVIPLTLSVLLCWTVILNIDSCIAIPKVIYYSYLNGFFWDSIFKQVKT